jgi:low affinity Fe/Cu permease
MPQSSHPRENPDNSDAVAHDASIAKTLREIFHKFSHKSSVVVGSPWAFIVATLIVVVWALLGHRFKYSDTWQLIINTGTTIVTFLMVFLIQNTQNRDARAIHLKLDELIRGIKGARNRLVDLENCTDEELDEMEKEFHRIRQKARDRHAPEEIERDAARAQEKVRTIADSPGRF